MYNASEGDHSFFIGNIRTVRITAQYPSMSANTYSIYSIIKAWSLYTQKNVALHQVNISYVRTHPFTFWFRRTDPESKMPAGRLYLS